MHHWRLGSSIVFLVAGVLLVAEWVTGLLFASTATHSSYSVSRNPNFIRGWEDYAKPKNLSKHEYRIIVIANSQGFLREKSDSRLCYPAILEDKVRERGYGEEAEVLNWSVPGGEVLEFILLAARSVGHRPDVVFLVGSNNSFSTFWLEKELISRHSGVTNLAYLQDVQQWVLNTFLERIHANDVVGWLRSHSNLLKWQIDMLIAAPHGHLRRKNPV